MKTLTLEWINKAEGDLITAQREYRARKLPNFDAACFHAQQCVEKYLKAWLCESDKNIPMIHNLSELAALSSEIDKTFLVLEPELKELNSYAVHTRYPGENASKDDAFVAIKITKNARSFIRKKLNLVQ